jgi:hypothetical protein
VLRISGCLNLCWGVHTSICLAVRVIAATGICMGGWCSSHAVTLSRQGPGFTFMLNIYIPVGRSWGFCYDNHCLMCGCSVDRFARGIVLWLTCLFLYAGYVFCVYHLHVD